MAARGKVECLLLYLAVAFVALVNVRNSLVLFVIFYAIAYLLWHIAF